MHDVLAHRLSLLSLQAGALEVTPGPDDATIEAAAAIRATTHQALQELRSVVRVLRDDDLGGPGGESSTAPPQPVAADLPAQVAEASATTSIHADWTRVELAEVPPDTAGPSTGSSRRDLPTPASTRRAAPSRSSWTVRPTAGFP
jgi:signal transduction histidine kinase